MVVVWPRWLWVVVLWPRWVSVVVLWLRWLWVVVLWLLGQALEIPLKWITFECYDNF